MKAAAAIREKENKDLAAQVLVQAEEILKIAYSTALHGDKIFTRKGGYVGTKSAVMVDLYGRSFTAYPEEKTVVETLENGSLGYL